MLPTTASSRNKTGQKGLKELKLILYAKQFNAQIIPIKLVAYCYENKCCHIANAATLLNIGFN